MVFKIINVDVQCMHGLSGAFLCRTHPFYRSLDAFHFSLGQPTTLNAFKRKLYQILLFFRYIISR